MSDIAQTGFTPADNSVPLDGMGDNGFSLLKTIVARLAPIVLLAAAGFVL